MKRILILLALICAALFVANKAESWSPTGSRMCATISKNTGDTVSVLLPGIKATQRYLIKGISITYDNAANTNPAYAMIQLPSYGRTVYYQVANLMVSSGATTVTYNDLNVVVPAPADSTAGGLIFFLSAASSDTLAGFIDYEVINY